MLATSSRLGAGVAEVLHTYPVQRFHSAEQIHPGLALAALVPMQR